MLIIRRLITARKKGNNPPRQEAEVKYKNNKNQAIPDDL
jgi:hypothetical protein